MHNELKKGVIISCQATMDEPLYNHNIMHLFAKCAIKGGAIGIRCLIDEVDSIKSEVDVPIICLTKTVCNDSEIYITPTIEDVERLIEKRPTVIAMDATMRKRPGGELLEDLVSYVRQNAPEIKLLADISTEEEADNAFKLGFDYISTTLRGYTSYTSKYSIPDMKFIKKLIKKYREKIIVEGGIWDVSQLRQVLKSRPHYVVIGTSVTRPKDITERFVKTFKKFS